MKVREYDFVYLTNTPSFYKLNLCESIARRGIRVLLVLYGYGAEAVNTRLGYNDVWSFDYEFINEGDSNKRSIVKSFWNLCMLMNRVKAKKILYAGWLAPEYNLYSFFSPRRKNIVISESRGEDVSMTGLSGFVKRLIIGRMGGALPSGAPHKQLFRDLDFKGRTEVTGSVGLINRGVRSLDHSPSDPLRYLYVGRLTKVKNLEFLVRNFTRLNLPLTVVGKGEDEGLLKSIAGPNINFAGFVGNEDLKQVYENHDVFVLPSSYESWGLVVEEALYWGLPVMVSDKVGSGPDMVRRYESGVFFEHDSEQSLEFAIGEITKRWRELRKNVLAIDWDEREERQVKAYLKML